MTTPTRREPRLRRGTPNAPECSAVKPNLAPRCARRREAGASFVELLLAVMIVSTTLVASTASMHGSSEVYHYFADGQHEALMLAQEIHEAANLMPWEHEAGAAAVFGPDVFDVWDLDGKTFNPPRSADYDVVVSHIGLSQHAEVRLVQMDNPEIEVTDPVAYQGETLVELKVTVKNGSTEVDETAWWMSEPNSGE